MSGQGSDAWNVLRLLQWTTAYLERHGSDSPRLDAEVLLAHVLCWPRIELYARYDYQPDEEQRATFRELVRRRAAGMPVAYLVGEKEFFSLPFQVSPAVLIPRPETEFVLTALLDLVKQRGQQQERLRIADVGTGSGCLAVCAARHLPQAQVTAIDVSSQALQIAEENARRHQVAERIRFVQGNLLEPVAQERFHYVMSNPPYLTEAELAQAPVEVRQYEPAVALVAGATGTEVIAPLVEQAARCLFAQGALVCEISPMIHQRVLGLFEPELWSRVETVSDLAGHPRVVVAVRKGERTGPARD